MPYKDKDKQREYQREWVAKRKADWFSGKACVNCLSTENLELDHVDNTTKISHRIWSWSAERRTKELKKCQVLCTPCHDDKTSECQESPRGSAQGGSKLTEQQVIEIRMHAKSGQQYRAIALAYRVSYGLVSDIVNRHLWTHI